VGTIHNARPYILLETSVLLLPFLLSSLSKSNTEIPRPSLVSHGDALPDLT